MCICSSRLCSSYSLTANRENTISLNRAIAIARILLAPSFQLSADKFISLQDGAHISGTSYLYQLY